MDTRRLLSFSRMALLACFFGMLAGCSLFSESKISGYDPVAYDGSRGSQVLRTAMSQIGKKYSYGKASPSQGFDCSGLIFWAYSNNGVKVPRNASAQSKAGKGVYLRNARQGDIIVFKVGRGVHTGLIADKGRFLHAPSSGSHVRLESYDSPYWRKRVVGVRRVL